MEIEEFSLADDGEIPNNPRLPARIYRQALNLEGHAGDVAGEMLAANGWAPAWVNGVLSEWHYHTTAHEALACISGRALVALGGESGARVEIAAGDVVLIPAGVGHRRLDASSDFRVVGGYAGARPYDMNYAGGTGHARALQAIAALPDPERDPVTGKVFEGRLT